MKLGRRKNLELEGLVGEDERELPHLREENADLRLSPHGRRVGLLTEERWQRFEEKRVQIEQGLEWLARVRVSEKNSEAMARLGLQSLKNGASLEELLRRPEVLIRDLLFLDERLAGLPEVVLDELETQVKYAGYIQRQLEQVERFRRLEELEIPAGFDYGAVSGLSAEVREKLKAGQPRTLGQAGRIPGVTPAALAILAVLLRR